jgi:two-component system, NarL family, nitrate/nitrite response regulator NarL
MSSIAMSVADPVNSQESRPVRILVADDHEVMRMGIRNLLESVPAWSVYAEAKTGREAVEIALAAPPDVIIMDITMPEMNGLEAAAKIALDRPDIPVIMFSLHLSEDVVGRFKTGSIRGAVAKSEAARDLLEAVRSVLRGGTFFPERSRSEFLDN